jgi:hypothetical protein
VIVIIENEIVTTREIQSNIEKHVRFSSGSRSKGPNKPQGSTAEDMRDRQFGNHLDGFYDGVISFTRGAESILIFGPGEAKVELENRLKLQDLGGLIVGVQAIDKKTNPQIEAKVRDYFLRKKFST